LERKIGREEKKDLLSITERGDSNEYFFSGDIDDDEELLDWLTDPGNMELTDHIERVNRKMFDKIRQTSDYLAVFFCEYLLLAEMRSGERCLFSLVCRQ